VYPDPDFRRCQEIYRQSPREWGVEFEPGDPAAHWWVSWLQDRVENGPYTYTSAFLDEIAEVIPQEASKDQFTTYQKVMLYRDVYIDARKYGLSVYQWGQNREDVHEKVRRKERWRVTMNGRANPTSSSSVVGWNSVPMNTDLTSSMPIGKALAWTQTNFEPFAWPDIPMPADEELKVSLTSTQANSRESPADVAEDGGVPS